MARVDELLYLETDGSCANCGHRDSRALTIHHLNQKKPKDESYENKLLLCHNCHQCHHDGRGPTSVELLEIKRRLIIKTLTRPGMNALKEADRRGVVFAMPFLVNHLVEFGYLVFQEELEAWEDEGKPDVTIRAIYSITDVGRKLLKKWDLK